MASRAHRSLAVNLPCGQLRVGLSTNADHYHRSANAPSTWAVGSIGIYSTSLQPQLELPHPAEGELAEGGDTGGGEGVSHRRPGPMSGQGHQRYM